MLAGARCLDRGVQRQEVRLVGDAGDRLEDAADLVRLTRELVDPGLRLLPGDANALHYAVGLDGGVDALVAELLRPGGGGRHLVGELAAALKHQRLALGALGDLGARRGDPVHRVRGLIDVPAHLGEQIVHALGGVDEQAQRLVHGRLELGRAV
jgi:hypothetical protein